MNTPVRIACLALAVLLTSTSMSSALSRTIKVATFNGAPIDVTDNTPIDLPPDNTPIDLPPDNTPIDLPPDNTPIDLPPDNTPIDLPPNPEDGLNDAVLDGVVDEDGKADTDTADGVLVLSCVVDGDDLIITNKGDPIPPGTKVKWAANGDHGTVLLPNGLSAGQKAKIENVLDGGAGKCSAEAVL